jgi:hypothetical protein
MHGDTARPERYRDRRGGRGRSIDVVRWYSAYAGYLASVSYSVKRVDP